MGNNENTKHSNIFKHTRSSAKSISEHIGILYHFQSLVADHKHVRHATTILSLQAQRSTTYN